MSNQKTKYPREIKSKKNPYYSIERHNQEKAKATVTFMSVVVFVLILMAIVYALFIRPKFYQFNGGEAELITTYTSSYNEDFVSIIVYEDFIYECTKNGLSKHKLDGTNLWSKGFYFEEPQMVQEGEFVAVADITGKIAYVFNKDGFLYEVQESYPIIFIDINENGFLTTVMEKEDENEINYYNNIGELPVTRNTRFIEDGYPISIDTSSDVTKMVTGYLNVSNNTLQTNISFFGFADQYDSFQENIIGAFSFENCLLNFVQWIDEETVIAVMDNGIYIYDVDEEPVLIGEISVHAKIIDVQATQEEIIVQYGEAIEFEEEKQKDSVIIYSYEGKQLKQFTFDENIKHIKAEKNNYFIVTSSRVIKFKGESREWFASTYLDVMALYEVSDKEFVAITSNGYEVIKLREK